MVLKPAGLPATKDLQAVKKTIVKKKAPATVEEAVADCLNTAAGAGAVAACKWCEQGECWTHGQTERPASSKGKGKGFKGKGKGWEGGSKGGDQWGGGIGDLMGALAIASMLGGGGGGGGQWGYGGYNNKGKGKGKGKGNFLWEDGTSHRWREGMGYGGQGFDGPKFDLSKLTEEATQEEVKDFLAVHTLDAEAKTKFKALHKKLQACVIKQGSMEECENQSSVLIARCRKANMMTPNHWVCEQCGGFRNQKDDHCKKCDLPREMA